MAQQSIRFNVNEEGKVFFCLPMSLLAHHSTMVKDLYEQQQEEEETSCCDRQRDLYHIVRRRIPNSEGEHTTAATNGKANSQEEDNIMNDDDTLEIPLVATSGHTQKDVLALLIEWVVHFSGAGISYPKPQQGALFRDLLTSTVGDAHSLSCALPFDFSSLSKGLTPPSLETKAMSVRDLPDMFIANARGYFESVLGNQWEANYVIDCVLLGGDNGKEQEDDEPSFCASVDLTLAHLVLPSAFSHSSEEKGPNPSETAPRASPLRERGIIRRFHKRLYFLSSLALYLDMPRLHSMLSLVTASMLVLLRQLDTVRSAEGAPCAVDGGIEGLRPTRGHVVPSSGSVFTERTRLSDTPEERRSVIGMSRTPPTVQRVNRLGEQGGCSPLFATNGSKLIVPSAATIVEARAQTAPDRKLDPNPLRGDGFSVVHSRAVRLEGQEAQQQSTAKPKTYYNPSHLASSKQFTYSTFSETSVQKKLEQGYYGGGAGEARERSSIGNGDARPYAERVDLLTAVLERQRALRSWFGPFYSDDPVTKCPPGSGWLTASEKEAIANRFAWCTSSQECGLEGGL